MKAIFLCGFMGCGKSTVGELVARQLKLPLIDTDAYLVEQEGEQEGFEGCLSLSGMYGIVKRPMKVKVQAQDRHGNPVEYEREGITARCFCHEIEHLDGHMYYEKAEGRLLTEDEVDEIMQKAEEEKA